MLHLVDYALLKPHLTLADVAAGAGRAEELAVASLCVQPVYVRYVKPLLNRVKLCTVVDFPHGAMPTDVRTALTAQMARHVDELDVVAPLPLLKSHMWREVKRDLEAVVANAAGRVVKIIIEEPNLTREEREKAIDIVAEVGAHFVKNSTGYPDVEYASRLGNPPHSTPERAAEMAKYIRERGYKLGLKMAGGIRTRRQAEAIIEAIGAGQDPTKVRIGTSTLDNLTAVS